MTFLCVVADVLYANYLKTDYLRFIKTIVTKVSHENLVIKIHKAFSVISWLYFQQVLEKNKTENYVFIFKKYMYS